MEHKPFKAPDLHAPRNRKKTVNLLAYTRQDPYGFFAAAKEQYPSLAELSNQKIAVLLKTYLNLLAQEVIDNRYGVRLPGGLGTVIVGLNKPSEKTANYNIDFATSKQLGVQVPYRNDNTLGYLAKIYYYNNIPRDRLKFHHLILFEACRKLKRAVAAVMKNEKFQQYIFFTAAPIREMFRKRKLPKAYRLQLNQEIAMKKVLADYHEFSFD